MEHPITGSGNAHSASAVYSRLESAREPFLTRARRLSKLTVPHLVVEENHGNNEFYQSYNSVGARAVNNLASKMLLALLPPNQPFFKYEIDPVLLAELVQADPNAKSELDKALGQIERAVLHDTEVMGLRVDAFEAFSQLVVAGSVLLKIPEVVDSNIIDSKVFKLDQHVVKRDTSGNVLNIIIKESVARETLPKEVQELVDSKQTETGSKDDNIDLYTSIKLNSDKTYTLHQEVADVEVPKSKQEFKNDELPFLALRFIKVDGLDYGYGYCSQYEGDLYSLERLSRSLVRGSAAAAKLLFLVRPGGSTEIADLVTTPDGGFAPGVEDDVSTLKVDKQVDFATVRQTVNDIEARVSSAFLMNSSIQRDAERVTAAEIRFMAQELENALGGIYTLLAEEFQMPLVRLLVKRLEDDNRITALPKSVQPKIVTGFDALGRGQDVEKLSAFLTTIQQTLGPEAVQWIDTQDALRRLGAAFGLDTDGLVKTQETIQEEQRQAQMAQLAQAVAPQATKALGDNINQQTEGQ